MIELINSAVAKGAKLFSNISGGKDGQAMTKVLKNWGYNITGLVHADLGKIEWKESITQCEKISEWEQIALHVVRRKDGRGLIDHWKHRMKQLAGTGKPFWSSSSNRFCTSDMKRDVINVFYTSTGFDFIISCEGIRASESTARAKKEPLTIRERCSSNYYKGMTVEQAIENFQPGKRLVLTWFPIFNFSTDEVWNSYQNTDQQLKLFRKEYQETNVINSDWNFHPAYVYGNERVSCSLCILASINDLMNGKKHNPDVWQELADMEQESGFTFRSDFSLQTMAKISKCK